MIEWEVWGEYGPVAYQTIDHVVVAKTEEAAKKKMVKYLKKNFPDGWKRIGERNVYARKKYN